MQTEMFALLEKLVLIQSGSQNKPGLDLMAETLCPLLKDLGLGAEILPMKSCGNMVRAWNQSSLENRGILLMGHMDTVFPKDSEFNWYKDQGEIVRGPGVMDMKGGLVTGVFALKALQQLGILDEIPVKVLFNSDEEIGSPNSRKLIEDQARECKAAFVLEGGGLDGQVAVGRKGKMGFELKLEGRAGHAGAAGQDKSSAVLEAAHKIIALEGLNRHPGLLVNAGVVSGGSVPNAVAREAVIKVDFRYDHPEDESSLKKMMAEIMADSNVPGVTARLETVSSRPAMPATSGIKSLYSLVAGVASRCSQKISPEFRGGVSDANFIAAMNIPVLDGMGPCGDMDHSHEEYIIRQSLPDRALLLASSLLGCSTDF